MHANESSDAYCLGGALPQCWAAMLGMLWRCGHSVPEADVTCLTMRNLLELLLMHVVQPGLILLSPNQLAVPVTWNAGTHGVDLLLAKHTICSRTTAQRVFIAKLLW